MRKRLKKKRHLPPFTEYGAQLVVLVPGINTDAVIDALLGVLAPMGITAGGGSFTNDAVTETRWFITREPWGGRRAWGRWRRSRRGGPWRSGGPMLTTTDLVHIAALIQTRLPGAAVTLGPLEDIWHVHRPM